MTWSEIPERRTQFGKHFANGLKRRFETIAGTPLHYDNEGSWFNVDR